MFKQKRIQCYRIQVNLVSLIAFAFTLACHTVNACVCTRDTFGAPLLTRKNHCSMYIIRLKMYKYIYSLLYSMMSTLFCSFLTLKIQCHALTETASVFACEWVSRRGEEEEKNCVQWFAYKLPLFSCSNSIAWKRALKFPAPNPLWFRLWMTSMNKVGRSCTGFVKICNR